MLLFLLLLGAAAAVVLVMESRGAPEWYAPPAPADPEATDLAERVEKRLAEEVHAIRPDEDAWTLRVRDEQINSWLAVRLTEWVEGRGVQWPTGLGIPQVRSRTRGLDVAVPVGVADQRRVVIAEINPRTDDEGLWLDLQRLRVGRIPIPGNPASTLASMVGEAADDDQQEVIDVLTGQRPVRLRFRLSDERRIEVEQVRCIQGALDVTSRTLGP